MTDEQLVLEIVKNNNVILFEQLYDRFATKIYNKCLSFSKSEAEAEDLTQDIFLMLFVKLGSFKGKSKFSSWVYSFTYNFCVNYVNRNKERKIRDTSDALTYNLSEEQSEEAISEMRSEKLKKALSFIEPETKTLLLLKYQDNVSIKELTELLNISESAVKMRLKRAKVQIIKIYKKLP